MTKRQLDIAVASGKGGSGKTTIALHLAWAAARRGQSVALCDCDAEAPNIPCFLPVGEDGSPVTELRPQIDGERCTACGECVRACAFHACYMFLGNVRIAEELCHGCGVCARVCPADGAITELPVVIGDLRQHRSLLPDDLAIDCVIARNVVGSTRTPAVIAAALEHMPADATLRIRDCAPGTACPAVAGLHGADLALLVTEATPFGLHDLKLSVELARNMKLPLAVVVNRCADYHAVQDWCAEEGIPVIGDIPDDRRVAEAYAGGHLAGATADGYLDRFDSILAGLGAVLDGEEQVA